MIADTLQVWRRTVAMLGPGDRAELSRRPSPPRDDGRPRLDRVRWNGDRSTARVRVATAAGELAELECWRLVLAPWDGDTGDGILFRGLQAPGQAFCGALRIPGRGVRVYRGSTPVAMLAAGASPNLPPAWRMLMDFLTVRRLERELSHGSRLRAVLPLRPPDDRAARPGAAPRPRIE